MIEVTREVPVEPARVFSVLADGWSYPLWVVGAAHMREVDENWPAVGSRLHHSVGLWPLLVNDFTEVVDVVQDRRIELRARALPTGTARIIVELEPVAGGTRITMKEKASSGPATLIPGVVQWALLTPRNRESLERLQRVALNRESPAGRREQGLA